MVDLLALTGGASLAGVWVYRRWRNQDAKPGWWQASWQTIQETMHQAHQRLTLRTKPSPMAPLADALTLAAQSPDHPTASITYGLRTSALALGATTVGWLIAPPLCLAGLPLLVYMGVPAAQRAYAQLWVNGRPTWALAETVVLVICLAGGYYWVSALGFLFYYSSRRWWVAQAQDEAPPVAAWLAPTIAHCRKAGAICAVPTAALHPGDQVMLCSGEMAPVDGLIIEGVGLLQPPLLPPTGCALRKSVGDRVNTRDIVLVGQLCVQVLEPTPP
jgi:cation transport ATPase